MTGRSRLTLLLPAILIASALEAQTGTRRTSTRPRTPSDTSKAAAPRTGTSAAPRAKVTPAAAADTSKATLPRAAAPSSAPAPAPAPSPASTQTSPTATAAPRVTDRSLEFGVDGNFTRISGLEFNQTFVPATLRLGYFVSRRASVELSANFSQVSGAGIVSASSTFATASLLWHVTGTQRTSQLYVRPFVGVLARSAAGSAVTGSSSDATVGGAVGIKRPIAGDRIAFRADGFYRRILVTPGDNAFGANFGISIYAR